MTIPTRPTGQVLAVNPARSLFLTDPDTVATDEMAAALHKAGITHVEMQIYPGVQDITPTQWDDAIWWKVLWANNNGFRLVGLGDCAFGTSYRQLEVIVRHAARRLRESGIVDGIEMKDECRNDPAFYQADDYIKWWRDEGGPPIAWNGVVPYRMETNSLSDYSSRYWPAYMMQDRNMAEISRQMSVVATPKLRKDRPFNILVSCADASYRGVTLVYAGVKPSQVLTQVAIAMAVGASGVRMWAYNAPFWRSAQAAHVPGQIQIGSWPPDGERWNEGVVPAFQWLKQYEAQLKLPCYEPVITPKGMWARRGLAGQGAFVWFINTTNDPQPNPHWKQGQPTLVPSGGVLSWDMMELMRS